MQLIYLDQCHGYWLFGSCKKGGHVLVVPSIGIEVGMEKNVVQLGQQHDYGFQHLYEIITVDWEFENIMCVIRIKWAQQAVLVKDEVFSYWDSGLLSFYHINTYKYWIIETENEHKPLSPWCIAWFLSCHNCEN